MAKDMTTSQVATAIREIMLRYDRLCDCSRSTEKTLGASSAPISDQRKHALIEYIKNEFKITSGKEVAQNFLALKKFRDDFKMHARSWINGNIGSEDWEEFRDQSKVLQIDLIWVLMGQPTPEIEDQELNDLVAYVGIRNKGKDVESIHKKKPISSEKADISELDESEFQLPF